MMIKLFERLKDKKCRGCLFNTLILIATTGFTGGSCLGSDNPNFVLLIGVIVIIIWVVSNIIISKETGKTQNGDNPAIHETEEKEKSP